MDAELIVEGVIGSIDALGPVPPSARRLASRLHVAPATLYSSVPSMTQAYGRARSLIAEEFAAPLVAALSGGNSGPLADALSERPNRAVFVTDPTWDLPDTVALADARYGTDITEAMMIDGLALVGSLFSIDSLQATPVGRGEVEHVLGKYRQAVAAEPTLNVPHDAVRSVVEAARSFTCNQQLNAVSQDIQVKSIDLIVSDAKWSFRNLRDQTGLAVSRLHRYGSRVDHMVNAYVALGEAVVAWADEHAEPGDVIGTRLAVLLETGAPEVLTELEHLRRCDPLARATPDQQQRINAIVGPTSLSIMTAQLRRGVDKSTIAATGGLVANNSSRCIAA